MISSNCLTSLVTINYAISPNQWPINKVACASISQFVKPLLMICKSASTYSTTVGESFYYNITLTNNSSYPLCVSIFDNLPRCVCYNSYSFVKDNRPLPYITLSKWIDLGILPPCIRTSISFNATLVCDLNIEEFSSIAYVYYSLELPNCNGVYCNTIKSNECIIKVDKNKQCNC